MKRILVFTLVLCLLAGTGYAQGASEPLRVINSWGADEAYLEAYPDRSIEEIDHFDDEGRSVVEDVIRSGEWDAACISTYEFSFEELDGLGLVLDLGSMPETAALADDLYPSIRTGCSVGDKLVALPCGHLSTQAYGYRLFGTDHNGEVEPEAAALRDQLGFTVQDQPTTFAEVCELGLRYMALDRDTRKGTCLLFSDSAPQGFSLLYYMILTYQAEATDENGNIDFDTPAFRAALANADPLLAAFAADPKRTYGADGSMYVVLCENFATNPYCFLPRTMEGTSIPAYMTAVIVNPKSERLSEAIDYAIAAVGSIDAQLALRLYQHADYDAMLIKDYDENIAAQREQGEDQSVIDELEARKAAGDDLYFVPRSTVERYAADVAPRLVFTRWKSLPMDDAIFDYLNGKTDAQGFIDALNASAGER